MRIQLSDCKITRLPGGIAAEGVFYACSGDEMRKCTGKHFININEFHRAKSVWKRSTRMIVILIVLGVVFAGVFGFASSAVSGYFSDVGGVFSISERINDAEDIMETMRPVLFGFVMIILTVGFIAAYLALIVYLMSFGKYLELSCKNGTIRIKYERDDTLEVKNFMRALNR